MLPIEGLDVDGLGLPAGLVVVLPPIGSHLGYASQAASLDQIDGIAKVSPATLLHAALQNLLAGVNGVGQGGAFLDGVGHRLFQVDVFAGGQRVACHAHVPVVRGRR